MKDESLTVDPTDRNQRSDDEIEQEAEPTDEEQAMAKLKEAILVERKEIGPLRLKLTITVPRDTLDERLGKQFDELRRDALIPGFRKGHAPLRLVEKRFGSDVGDQLKSQLVGSGFMAAVQKEDLKPLGDPLFCVKVLEEPAGASKGSRKSETEKLLPLDKALDHLAFPKDGPLTFSCEMELKPEFELPPLGSIPITRPALQIDDDDVEAELGRMRMNLGAYQPVEDGPIQPNDLLYASMTMSVGGQRIESDESFTLTARDARVKGVQLVGLGDALVGKTTADVVRLSAVIPEDHDRIDLRGKTAQFEFTIREVKRLEVPPLDGDLLKGMGFDSEDDLRQSLRSALESRLENTIQRAMHEQIGKYLLEHTTLEIPAGLSQRQTDRMIARRVIDMYNANVPEVEIQKSIDEMRTKAQDQAVLDLKLFFILEKIAEDRKIEVREDQINGAIAEIARRTNRRFDRVRDELSKGDGLGALYYRLRDGLAFGQLLADAEITETPPPEKAKDRKKITKKNAPKTATKGVKNVATKSVKKTAKKANPKSS